jgi:GDPmannose 4,6-dehydratase
MESNKSPLQLTSNESIIFIKINMKNTSIRFFVGLAFKEIAVELQFEVQNENGIAKVVKANNPLFRFDIGKVEVRVNSKY